jgi:hypothetical protein
VVADTSPSQAPAGSLLAALNVSAPLPTWLVRQLGAIRCVAHRGGRQGGRRMDHADAYYRDGRGGRSVFVEPRDHQFGASRWTRAAPRWRPSWPAGTAS